MDIVAAWQYLDGVNEGSQIPQVRGVSSDVKFQAIYWKCVVVFFESSLRFNADKKHLFFTNCVELPVIGGVDLSHFFISNKIEVVVLEKEYKVPQGYYKHWNNQFYLFSIFKYLSLNYKEDYRFLLIDSDCVFTKPIDPLFRELEESEHTAFSYLREEDVDREINGLSRRQMKTIFEELGLPMTDYPLYSGGEIFCAKNSFVETLVIEFPTLWQDLLARFETGRDKFHEEGHMFSYYYYRFNSGLGRLNPYLKRIWTNPIFYRNVHKTDSDLTILHVPAEKGMGISDIFNEITRGKSLYDLSEEEYKKMITKLLSPWKHYQNIPVRLWEKIVAKEMV